MRVKAGKRTAPRQAVAPSARGIPTPIGWLVPVTIAAVTFLAFLPALQNGFLAWDDEDLLLKNPAYRGLGWSELRWMFTTFHFGHYHPLTWMTFGLDYLVWGMEPFGYHLTNLLLHAANTVLFYWVVVRLLTLAAPLPSLPQQPLALRVAAGAAALLFSVHPLRVESVAWITERRDVLSALFLLVALLGYLRAVGAQSSRRRLAWLVGTLAVYAFSLLSKGVGMTFPVILVVLDIYPLRRLEGSPEKWFAREARPIWWEKVPFFGLGLAAALIAAVAQYQSGAMLSMERHGLVSRAAQAFFGLAFYLWKTAAPFNLSPLYEIPQSVRIWEQPFLLSVVVVLAISAGFIVARRRWPGGLAVWVSYAAILAPTLGVAQSGPQFVADRYTYLSCLGWAVLAGAGLYRSWLAARNSGIAFPVGLAAGLLAVVGFGGMGILSWRQTEVWRSNESLWRHAVAATPESSGAHYNLASHLESQGKTNEAMEHYRRALEIKPNYMRAHNNLGVMLAAQGLLEEAMGHYRKVLDIDSDSAEAHTNLGNALFRQNDVEGAIHHFEEALRVDPDYIKAHNGLGIVFAQQGKINEAVAWFQQALEIDPNYAVGHLNLGHVLASQGALEKAVTHYRNALQKEPRLVAAHEALGRILAMQGKREEAIRHMEESLRIMKAAPARLSDQDTGQGLP